MLLVHMSSIARVSDQDGVSLQCGDAPFWWETLDIDLCNQLCMSGQQFSVGLSIRLAWQNIGHKHAELFLLLFLSIYQIISYLLCTIDLHHFRPL